MDREGARILLVDDEKAMRDILTVALQPAGYTLFPVRTAAEAIQSFHSIRPDLILLDLFLPDLDGKEVIRHFRERTAVPIVVISVRSAESEKILSLDAGADDYVMKPFTIGELLARVRAALRRSFGSVQSEIFKSGTLKVDLKGRAAFVSDTRVNLTATEYDLLKVFVRHAGLVRTHRQLIQELWGNTQYQDSVHLLRVTVSNLRRKLACDVSTRRFIVTEPGVGYRLRTNLEWARKK